MIGKLEMFIALAKERHFGRAAESLGVTQPTLSTGIRQLEDQLGVKLVKRGSRFGGLTPEGQSALIWARRIVGDSKRFVEEMRFSKHGLSGTLKIAVIPTALTWAARLTSSFNRIWPNVSFTIHSRTSNEILTMLDDLDVDAGISYLDNEPLGRVSTAFLYREQYTLVCAEDHRLASRAAISWGDLDGAQLSLLTPDMQNRRIINKYFMDAGATPVVQIKSGSTVALVAHVERGGRATILPGDLAKFLAAGKGLKVIPIRQGGEGHAVGLLAPYYEPQTPLLQALLKQAAAVSEGSGKPGKKK